MVDNVRITQKANSTPPDGTVVKTDQIGTAHYQIIKVDIGGDGVSVPLVADGVTNSLRVITYPHHEIHEGSAFEIKSYKDLAINKVRDIRITTPNTTKWAHFTLEFDTKSETLWYLYENVAIVNTGTAITPINCNRNSTGASVLIVIFFL